MIFFLVVQWDLITINKEPRLELTKWKSLSFHFTHRPPVSVIKLSSLSSIPTELYPVLEWWASHGLSFSHSSSVCLPIPCLLHDARGCWDHWGSPKLLAWCLACKTTVCWFLGAFPIAEELPKWVYQSGSSQGNRNYTSCFHRKDLIERIR